MSLTGKQIRELNSAYKSIYVKQESVVENLAITKEEFNELCISILAEAFEGNGIEIYDQTDLLQEVTDPKTQAKNIVKELIKKGVKGTIKTLINPKTLLGIGIGADATTGGKFTRTGLGLANNAIPIARDMFTAVSGDKEFAGTVLKDREKGTFSTAEQDRKKTKKESVQFALHIVEDDSIKDLIDKKNKKDQKDSNKDSNIINKDKENDKKQDTGSFFTSSGQNPKNFKNAEAQKEYLKKLNNKDVNPAEIDDTKYFKDTSNDNIKNNKKNEVKPEDDTKKNEVKPPEDDKKNEVKPEDDTKKNEVKPPEDDKKNEVKPESDKPKYVQVTQKMLDDKLAKDKAEAKAKADAKAAADAKAKDKLLSTHIPVVSKTKLGSTVRPVKPGSSRDKMIARNEVIHGSDKIVKKREMNADFQRMKKGEISKTDFVKQYPNSQTAKKYKLDMISRGKKFENYEPYHIVLGYLLSEGHADTINEAHYVMTQMDDETVQEIVSLDEIALGTAAGVAGALTLGGMGLNAIRKQMQNKKKMDQGGTFKQGSMMDNIQKKKNMLKNLENY